MTSSLKVSSKSISKSGIDIRAGFKNLSKRSAKGMGSTSVILTTHANKDPAPDHLPGPTTILCSFARQTKSATIKK